MSVFTDIRAGGRVIGKAPVTFLTIAALPVVVMLLAMYAIAGPVAFSAGFNLSYQLGTGSAVLLIFALYLAGGLYYAHMTMMAAAWHSLGPDERSGGFIRPRWKPLLSLIIAAVIIGVILFVLSLVASLLLSQIVLGLLSSPAGLILFSFVTGVILLAISSYVAATFLGRPFRHVFIAHNPAFEAVDAGLVSAEAQRRLFPIFFAIGLAFQFLSLALQLFPGVASWIALPTMFILMFFGFVLPVTSAAAAVGGILGNVPPSEAQAA